MNEEKSQGDLLAEWLAMGGEVLKRYYPDAKYAVLVAELGEGIPAVQFVVTPRDVSASAVPPAVIRG